MASRRDAAASRQPGRSRNLTKIRSRARGASSSRSFPFLDEDDVLRDEIGGESGAGAVRDSSYLEVGAFRVVVPLEGQPKADPENLAGLEILDCPDRLALVVNRVSFAAIWDGAAGNRVVKDHRELDRAMARLGREHHDVFVVDARNNFPRAADVQEQRAPVTGHVGRCWTITS